MKIIKKDNFDRETYSDEIIAAELNMFYAYTIVGWLNQKYSGDNSSHYFVAVEDDYKPYIFSPE